ncbi:MAG: DUF1801 domain-containing protein [Saprospiraceae bacterium]
MAKLAKVKTTENELSVEEFINGVADEQKRKDSLVLLSLMEKASKEKPKMWGNSLIGFGKKRIISESGREVEWFDIGFSPRKANFSIYLMNLEVHADAPRKLGKHKTGMGCLYVNKLADVDMKVLEAMINDTLKSK